MAFTDQEKDIARQIKEQGGTQEDFLDILQQVRAKQPAPVEATVIQEEVQQPIEDTGLLLKEPGLLENKLSEAVTGFGERAVESAREETIPATGKEIPFVGESPALKNFKPSFEKAVGQLAETIGSPVDSLANLGTTLKAVLVKGVEGDPILGRFIKSSEGDKIIQEALTGEAQKFRSTVKEQGLGATVNKAFQEDPLLGVGILTSLFKKLGRVGGISKKDQIKVDNLQKEAESKVKEFIKPTKGGTKQKTAELAPEIVERIKTGKLTPLDRESMKDFTATEVSRVGKEIGDFISEGKVKGEINFDKLIDTLATEDSKLRIDGKIMPGNEAKAKFINSQVDFLGQLQSKYGKNLPADKQIELRRAYDVVLDKAVTRDKITKFQDDLQVRLADTLRAELAKNNPDLAKLNKEFTFMKGLDFVLEETLERTTGQDSVGLISELRKQSQGTLGAVVGGGVGATAGPVGAVVGAVLGGAIGGKITKVTSSPKYKLIDVKKKAELAEAIANGNAGKVEKLLDSIILSTGIQESGTEKFIR